MDADTPVTPFYLLSPEQIAGRYFSDPKLIRRNISEGADGVPLVLRLKIVDAMTGQPVTDALVDIWHCTARGAAHTNDDTCLRGGQFTDHNGIARFTTICPGVYAGRTRPIHVAVRITSGNNYLHEGHVAWVGRLCFPDVAARSVPEVRGDRGRAISPLSSEQDHDYQNMGGEDSTLSVHALGRDSKEDGYLGYMTIGIDTFAVSTQIKPEDFDKYTV